MKTSQCQATRFGFTKVCLQNSSGEPAGPLLKPRVGLPELREVASSAVSMLLGPARPPGRRMLITSCSEKLQPHSSGSVPLVGLKKLLWAVAILLVIYAKATKKKGYCRGKVK